MKKVSRRRSAPRQPSRRPDRVLVGPVRTCVGCCRADQADALVRLVVSAGGQVAADLGGRGAGRGAHVHPAVRCLALAPRGLHRGFRRPVETTAGELASLLARAAHGRMADLLVSAVRSHQVHVIDTTDGGRAGNFSLLVVACDAADRVATAKIVEAVAKGDAVAWGTKAELGTLMRQSEEVAVLGIVSPSLSAAVRSAMAMASSVASSGGARRTALAGAAMGTEDR